MTKTLFRDRVVPWVARAITRHPRSLAIVVLAFGAFFWAFLPRLAFRPDVDDFMLEKHPDVLFRTHLRSLFTNNEFVAVVYRTENLFTIDQLRRLQQITESLEEVELAREVVSLANVSEMRGDADGFSVGPFLDTIPETPAGLAALRQRALDNPLYRNRLISHDGRTTALILYTQSGKQSITYRGDLVRAIQRALAPYEEKGMTFHLAGWPVTNYSLAVDMKQDLRRFVPLTFGLVAFTIWLVFRNGRLLLLSVFGIGATVLTTLGLTALAGVSLGNASAAAIPIVMALALSDLIHIFSHLNADVLKNYPTRQKALAHVLEQILFPCSLTSLNTAIGFFSLSLSGVPAIAHFGWLVGAGMVFEFIFAFGLVTPLILAFDPKKLYRSPEVQRRQEIPRLLRASHALVLRYPKGILVLCMGAGLWGFWGSTRLKAETNLVDFFQPSARVRSDIEFVQKELGGITALDLYLESDDDGAFREPENLTFIEQFQDRLKKVEGVDAVTSLADYFKQMNRAFHGDDPSALRLPSSRRMVDQYLLLYSADDLEDYVTSDFRRTRLMFRLQTTNTGVHSKIVKRMEEVLREMPSPRIRLRIAGDAMAHIRTADGLVGEQLQNVGSAVLTIWVVMVFVLRSLGMAILFLLPNLFPILINFGVMGYLGIPLDTGTSLIAAAAFGVIVDDTVHFFTRFQEFRARGEGYFPTLREVSFEKGEAMASSFFILCAGFGVMSLSAHRPIMFFGLLNVLVLMVGFVGDQFLLKSLLVGWGRWKKEPEF